jgi:hypothetical protein
MDFNFKPRIVKNLLTSSEQKELKDQVRKIRTGEIEHPEVSQFQWWGRINHSINIPGNILKKFLDVAHTEGSPELEMTDHASFCYDIKYGDYTQLPPHLDAPKNQLQMDYQLESNASWPIYVEGEKFVLEDNDVLLFAGGYQMHWREEKTLSPGEFVDMFDISFAVPNFQERYDNGEFATSSEHIDIRHQRALKIQNPIKRGICISRDQLDHSNCNHFI